MTKSSLGQSRGGIRVNLTIIRNFSGALPARQRRSVSHGSVKTNSVLTLAALLRLGLGSVRTFSLCVDKVKKPSD